MISINRINYVAACYCRLSQDDENDGTSVSIETQCKVLEDYCTENRIRIHDFYCDDGFTGTNFDRPAFKRMMQDIDNGVVNTIIVKDLSRFGRDHVGVGNYLQFVFPENDINFISIGDNVEVNRENPGTMDMMISIKNVFNELYPADCSNKVRQALTTKAKHGEFIGSQAPYGYIKSPKDKHILIIDEEIAPIVREIFEMAAYKGYGYNKIAHILCDKHILTPSALQAQRSGKAFTKNPYLWNLASVGKLLENTVYLGTLTSGKRKKVNYKSKKVVKVSEDKWIVNENMHEPIISQKLWDDAHIRLESRKRRSTSGFDNIFAGLLKCEHCGYALGIANAVGRHKYYTCNNYKKQNRNNPVCTIHYTLFDELYESVLADIRAMVSAVHTDEDAFRKAVMEKANSRGESEQKSMAAEITMLESQIAGLVKKYDMLYDDRLNGIISENKFKELSERCENDQIRLTERLNKLKNEAANAEQQEDNIDTFIELVKEYSNIDRLDKEILNKLIEKITVGDRTKFEDGTVSQNVTIYYRFLGSCGA